MRHGDQSKNNLQRETKAKLGGSSMMCCHNCPSRGCKDCPMYGVGLNPLYLTRLEEREAKREARAAPQPATIANKPATIANQRRLKP